MLPGLKSIGVVKTADDVLNVCGGEDAIKQAFYARGDIASLSEDEQDRRWSKHQIAMRAFSEMLAGLEFFALER